LPSSICNLQGVMEDVLRLFDRSTDEDQKGKPVAAPVAKSVEELKKYLGDTTLCRPRDGSDRRPGPWRAVVWSFGSRGDFQPFLILADALKQRGFEVKIYSDMASKKPAEEWGHDFVAVYPCNVEEMQRNDKVMKAAESGDIRTIFNTWAKAAFNCDSAEKIPEEQKAAVKKATQDTAAGLDAFQPDVVLHNSLAVSCKTYCQPRGIPDFQVDLQPQNIPSEATKPLGMFRVERQHDQPNMHLWFLQVTGDNVTRDGIVHEKALYEAGMEKELEESVMSGAVELAEERFDNPFFLERLDRPIFQAYSRALFPPQSDWPAEVGYRIFGNFKVSAAKQKELAERGSSFYGGDIFKKVTDFIAAGTPPVYIGWGSMVVRNGAFMCRVAVGAVKKAGQRAIILSGWANLNVDQLDGTEEGDDELKAFCADNVLFIKAAPHEWLFPQCICAVHHGGVGTTQATMGAGLPTIVTPVLSDQWDISEQLIRRKLGAGTSMTLAEVTPAVLGEKIKLCSTDPEIRANVKKLSMEIQKEDGASDAVDFVEKFLENDFKTGAWKEKVLERKKDCWARFLKRKKRNPDQVVAMWSTELAKKFPQLKAYQLVTQKRMMLYNDLVKDKKLFTVKAESGLVTREGEGLKTKELGRIQSCSILEKLEEKGGRMKVKMHEGFGPTEGWVSTKVGGKDVLDAVKDLQGIGEAGTAVFMRQFRDV